MKFCAIKNPRGEWVEDAVATTEEQAWVYAGDTDHDFPSHPEYHRSESGEAAGYCCVEVELAKPGTTDALKRARGAWNALAAAGAWVDGSPGKELVIEASMQTLGEVLGRVTDNAEGDRP